MDKTAVEGGEEEEEEGEEVYEDEAKILWLRRNMVPIIARNPQLGGRGKKTGVKQTEEKAVVWEGDDEDYEAGLREVEEVPSRHVPIKSSRRNRKSRKVKVGDRGVTGLAGHGERKRATGFRARHRQDGRRGEGGHGYAYEGLNKVDSVIPSSPEPQLLREDERYHERYLRYEKSRRHSRFDIEGGMEDSSDTENEERVDGRLGGRGGGGERRISSLGRG